MKHIIYYRYPSYQSKEEVDKILKMLDSYVFECWKSSSKHQSGVEIILEEANNLLAQQKLGALIVRLKNEKSTHETTTIVFYDLISLVGDNILAAIAQLTELDKLAIMRPYSKSRLDLSLIRLFINEYIEKRKDEKAKLLQYRIAKNGQSYGRPLISVDIEKATKLRAEGLSYQEISNRMGQSLSLIYSKLPKEVKVKYRKLRYERVGRPRKVT